MVVTSRSYAEYCAMFDLAEHDLGGGVADVCAGGSSFVAECGRQGVRAVAIDPAYASDRHSLAAAVRAAVADGHAIIAAHADRFVWDYYAGTDHHRSVREAAAERFLADRDARPGSYVAGALPHLPLRDGAVDLVLCSHLLFTWCALFDADWHLAALQELLRVARREVRVFPLVAAGTGESVPFLPALVERLEADVLRP